MAEHSRIDMKRIEQRLMQTATELRYPETPDIASGASTDRYRGHVSMRPRWAAIAAVVVLGFAMLMAIPPVRSAVIEWIRAGAILIYQLTTGESTDPRDHPPAEPVLLEAAKLTTLDEANDVLPFDLMLPAWPKSLGRPGEVYIQDRTGHATAILIWRHADHVGKLALYQMEGEGFWFKSVERVADARVKEQQAHWVDGPHLLRRDDGDWLSWMLVEGPVLIWTTNAGITYRLETGLQLEEAVRIAESLHRYQPDLRSVR